MGLENHLKAGDEKVGQAQHMENSVRSFLVRLSRSLETVEQERIETDRQAGGMGSYA